MDKHTHGLVWRGEYTIIGVPARNLTPEEARRHIAAIRAAEAAHGVAIYDPAPVVPPAPAVDAHKDAGEKPVTSKKE